MFLVRLFQKQNYIQKRLTYKYFFDKILKNKGCDEKGFKYSVSLEKRWCGENRYGVFKVVVSELGRRNLFKSVDLPRATA